MTSGDTTYAQPFLARALPAHRNTIPAVFLLSCMSVLGAAPALAAQSACLPEDIQELTGLETYEDFYQQFKTSYSQYGSSPDVCVKVWSGWTAFDTPGAQYLAREFLATNTLTLGIVEPKSHLYGYTLGSEVEVNLGFKPYATGGIGNAIRFGLEYSDASYDQYIGEVDPGAGYGLGIPGPQGGASGAFLSNNPANIVQNAGYTADLSWAAPYFNFERRFEGRRHAVGAFAGVQFSNLDYTETFWGDVPGYLSDFRYDTQIDTQAWGVHLGLRGRFDVGQPIGKWQPQFAVRGQVGVAHVSADVTDSLSYGGFIGTLIPNSSITLSDDYTRLYYSLGASLALNNVKSSTQFFVDAQLDGRPWFPTVMRNGTNASTFVPGTAIVFSLTGGMRIRF